MSVFLVTYARELDRRVSYRTYVDAECKVEGTRAEAIKALRAGGATPAQAKQLVTLAAEFGNAAITTD